MDHQPSGLDFALIGHQECWEKISDYVRMLRLAGLNHSPDEETIRDIFPYIPPRPLFEIIAKDIHEATVRGIYIETFISPDELDAAHLFRNLNKVQEACRVASACRAKIAALGGFTSIVLESGNQSFEKMDDTWFTTGNTLTASFIVEAVEMACDRRNLNLKDTNLLVVGSTGDIGSACVRYFSNKVHQIRLCARKETPLISQAMELEQSHQAAVCSRDINELIPGTDIVISVASSMLENADFDFLPDHAIICDAGYPKNMGISSAGSREFFLGGLGSLSGGYDIIPGKTKSLYGFPAPNVIHGCLLEAIVLSFANRGSAFSKGKGNITTRDMGCISTLARQHGITVAPLFNNFRCWN